MATAIPQRGQQILSTVESDGRLLVELVETPVVPPGPDEVLIRVEATPINPSDMMILFPADPAGASFRDSGPYPAVTAQVPDRIIAARAGAAMPVGLEGAGTVIAAGDNGQHLLGRQVAALTLRSGMFSQYRNVPVSDCAPLPEGVTAAEGATMFCNPLTALAIVETLHQEGYDALVHTAGASNLGRMLAKICAEDGIPLVAVVRRDEHVELLRQLGATHVCNSAGPDFPGCLIEAIAETGAYVAFDAIGGAEMPHQLLSAMETAACLSTEGASAYGSPQNKQVYVYGHLGGTELRLDSSRYGMIWDVAGWAMPPILAKAGEQRTGELMQRILTNIKTTFASSFSREISLAQALEKDIMLAYLRQASGEKYLIRPHGSGTR